jgi:hypothetical protein
MPHRIKIQFQRLPIIIQQKVPSSREDLSPLNLHNLYLKFVPLQLVEPGLKLRYAFPFPFSAIIIVTINKTVSLLFACAVSPDG